MPRHRCNSAMAGRRAEGEGGGGDCYILLVFLSQIYSKWQLLFTLY